MVERSEPTSTTLGCGHAMLPTTRLPPMLSPNLDRERGGGYTWPSIGRNLDLTINVDAVQCTIWYNLIFSV